MIPHRSLCRRGQSWTISLLVALVIVVAAQPVAASPATAVQASVTTPTRIEGLLKSIEGNIWLVDQTTVELDDNTTLIEKRGPAVVGAWVVVWGEQISSHLRAEIIHVLRPAGTEAPPFQFTGVLHKTAQSSWIVEDTLVTITDATEIIGEPALESLVSVLAQRDGYDMVATQIEVLAPDPASMPVSIEGDLETVTDTEWVVDGLTIRVKADEETIVSPGDRVEVKAIAANDGTLVALSTRVVDESRVARLDGYVTGISGLGEENQTWSVLVFDEGRPQTKTVHVSVDTYVDEGRTVLEPDVEAQVDGSNLAADEVVAALVRLEQPAPAEAAGALTAPGEDGLWDIGGQKVWIGSDQLQQSALEIQGAGAGSESEADDGVVVKGVRLRNGVLIAKEIVPGGAELQPSTSDASIDAPWTDPIAIVPGVGKASLPTLLFAPDRTAHLVYESLGAIHHAVQSAGGKWGASRRIATGTSPSAAFDAKGQLHVAYVNEFMGKYDIYHVRFVGGAWTLPINLSSTTGLSADPSVAPDHAGKMHVAWMDNTCGQWAIHTGTWDGEYWTSYPVSNARGQNPSLVVLPDKGLFLAWQDRVPTTMDTWGNFDIYVSERKDQFWELPANVSDNATFSPGANSLGVSVTTTGDGMGHLAWIDDERQVRYTLGRGLYWPAPIDVGGPRTLARGLNIELGQDGQLYIAWDEGDAVRVTAAPPSAQTWPKAAILPSLAGDLSDVSLVTSTGGAAVAWVQRMDGGEVELYESRHNMARELLKTWLPFLSLQ